MKKITTTLLCMFALCSQAQTREFNFEAASVPTQWTSPENSVLSVSTLHYKEGKQSLCWKTNGKIPLSVSLTKYSAKNSAFMYIYNQTIKNDTLLVEFMEGSVVRKTAKVLLNYSGWREFNRCYIYDYGGMPEISNVDKVIFTLMPTKESNTREIFFDAVNFDIATNTKRKFGPHMILDYAKLNWDNTTGSFQEYANPIDIDIKKVTQKELSDFQNIKEKLKKTPAKGNEAKLTAARDYARSFAITRNPDESVKGNIIDTKVEGILTTNNNYLRTLSENLQYLASSTINTDKELFNDLLDHILDQGVAEGAPIVIGSSNYTDAQNLPANLLNILPNCSDKQRDGVLKLIRWTAYYGRVYHSESNYRTTLDSDIIYNFLPHFLSFAAYQLTPEEGVRELKAIKRFMERNTEYIPGGGDIFKPDGTGFHHATHYNNYMYAYRTWADAISLFKGTAFGINQEAFDRFKKAILTVYSMSTKGVGYYYSNTFAGRNPFRAGIDLQFSKEKLEALIETGKEVLGIDEELATAYNYYYGRKYDVAEKNLDGFYQYNYSPAAIYRKDNWVATMRSITTKFWGAEIYSGQNRFGRYQSHGVLDIMYNGDDAASSLLRSGYPTNGTGGGWDWNMVPGTTTVHYNSWEQMMPNQTKTDRFDQFAKTKNFSGALSWLNCGIFTTDFDQVDSWGSPRFTPTNLEFKKTVFAFGDILISMGNGISALGDYGAGMITATNLFQGIDAPGVSDNLIVNGSVMFDGDPAQTFNTKNNDLWMVTPQGTGYFVPKGNDPVIIMHGVQSSPAQNGDLTLVNATAAKSYINHGSKPSNKEYLFVAVPATDATKMATLSTSLSKGEYYKVEARTSALHALTYKPLGITAYSFFEPVDGLAYGLVKSVASEMLLMEKYNQTANTLSMAICNPNLRPKTDYIYNWKSSETRTSIIVNGIWFLKSQNEGSNVSISQGSTTTTIDLTLSEGSPIYLELTDKETGINNVEKEGILFEVNDHTVTLFNVSGIVQLFDITGKLIKSTTTHDGTTSFAIENKGYYIVKANEKVTKLIIK